MAVAVIAGAFLRLYQIPDQILADDEWHAVNVVLYKGFWQIFTRFRHDDNCIPLTLFYEAVSRTVGLSEITMRFPALLSGIASLVVFPILIRGVIGPRAAGIFAWLLAISPLHTYFSRYARPYAISLFFAFLAAAAFYAWWVDGRQRWSILYAVCTATAGYFHLFFLPAALAPLCYGFAQTMWRRGRGEGRGAAPLLLLAIGTMIVLLIFLGPPLFFSGAALLKKAGRGQMDWVSSTGAAELLLGTGNGWLVSAILAGMLAGVRSLFRKNRLLLCYLGCIVGAQVAAVLVSSPAVLEMPIVAARYGFALLPIFLLLLARGIGAAEELVKSLWSGYPAGTLGYVACATLLFLGPLPAIYYHPNAWTNHALFQYSYSHIPRVSYYTLRPATMPQFYDILRQFPRGSRLLVEAPWRYEWDFNSYPFYQAQHRQRMKIGSVLEPGKKPVPGELRPVEPELNFRNIVHVGDERKLAELGVDYVIFHKRPNNPQPVTVTGLAVWMDRYRRSFGVPSYEDSEMVVYGVKGRTALLSFEISCQRPPQPHQPR